LATADTTHLAAPAPRPSAPDTQKAATQQPPTGTQTAGNTRPSNTRTVAQPPRQGPSGTGAAAVSVEDSLSAAAGQLSADHSGPARSIAMFVYNWSQSSSMQKARAAKMIAESYLADANADDAKIWLRNAIRLNPGDTVATSLLQRLGGSQ